MPAPLPATYVIAVASLTRAASRARKAALFLFSLAVLLAGSTAAVRGQSALDGFDPDANGVVSVVAVQPDGKILIAGGFTTVAPNGGLPVTRNHIARLNGDGTLDTAFNPNANGYVISIAVQADGKILVGGQFNSIGGQSRLNIARLDGTTGLADSFNPNANGVVWSMVVLPDGRVLVGGSFTSIGGEPRFNIARLDATTGLADSFDPIAGSSVYSIALDAEGKILVGGFFSHIGGQPRNRIARLDATTGLPDSFDPNSDGPVYTIALQADGKILVGGLFDTVGGQARQGIARLDPASGDADSFDPDAASGGVAAIAVQTDGKILVAGNFGSIGGQARSFIARLHPTTGLADSFNPSPSSGVSSIAMQSDGKILLGGFFFQLSPSGGPAVRRNNIARLEINGTLDQTLNLSMEGFSIWTTTVQADGKILLGGQFSSVLGVSRNNIARLNVDGTLDLAFNPNTAPNFTGVVQAITVQADGKILVGGNFTSIGGQTRNHIARLDPATGLADSFNPNADDDVSTIVVQADGRILVGGQFTNIGGQSRNQIARLDPATGLADSFDPNPTGPVVEVGAIAQQADGKILVGGQFTGLGGQPRNDIARLDVATGLADSFNPNSDGSISAIVIQPDGRILVGGFFFSIGGQARHGNARLDPSTGLADSFDPNSNNSGASSLAIQADGKIVAGGFFSSIGGQMRSSIARLEPANGLADSFDPDAHNSVSSIVLQPDGKILVAGGFSSIGGRRRPLFARLTNDTAARQDLAVTQTTITWTRGGSSPQFARVTFESSNDNESFTPLGTGTAAGSNWFLTGLSLPSGQNFYIRARGYYSSGVSEGNITESVRNAFIAGPTPTPAAAQAINLSTRMRVETGDNVGIGGFIVTGTAPKHVLLRAIGPSLGALGVPNVLADPVMELHGPAGFATIINNNWRDDPAQEALIIASGIPPTNNLESAIDATLLPGAYTAVVSGNNNSSGVGLVEVYDISHAVDSKLANISTRALVGIGDDIVIAGFILGNRSGDDRIVLRGIGPSLTSAGVPDAMADPTLELRDNNGALLAMNNDWQDDLASAAELIAAGLAPTDEFESGIAATLSPGLYTALLAGMNNGTGIGLVEVYDRGDGSGGPTPTPSATVAPTPTPTPSATVPPTPSPTPSGTPTPVPTPSPVCFLIEGFDNITTLPGAGWVQTNRSSTGGNTDWFQGNGAVFPAHSGAAASYIAANYNNRTSGNANAHTNINATSNRPVASPLMSRPDTPPSPTPGPPGAISNWLLTPPFMLRNGATMTFYTRTVDVPQFPDRLQVRMSTNGPSTDVGTTANDVGDFTTLLLDINPGQTEAGYPNVWTQFTVTVGGLGSLTPGRLAFRYFVVNGGPDSGNADYIGVDSVSFSCAVPTPTPTPPPPPTPTPAAGRAGN